MLSNWHKAISEEYPLLKADYMVSRRGVQIEAEKGICDFCEVKDAIGASQHEAVILHNTQSEVAFSLMSEKETMNCLIVRYAATSYNLIAQLRVNGEIVDTLNLVKTRNRDTFVEKWFNVPFKVNKGMNIVSVSCPSDTLVLDYIQLCSVEDYPHEKLFDFSTSSYHICNKQTHHYITFDTSCGIKENGVELRPLSLEEDKGQSLRLEYQGYPLWKICVDRENSADICLEIKFGAKETLSPMGVVSQGYSMLRPFQYWAIFPIEDSCFRIMNKHTGMYLESKWDSCSRREYLVQNPYSERETQKWRFKRNKKIGRNGNLYPIGSAISEAIKVYDVAHQFDFYTNNGLLSPKGYTLFKAKSGRCVDEANFSIYLCRHLGIPAAEDFAPHWGNRSQGHSWSVIVKPDGKAVVFYNSTVPGDTVHYFHPYKKPKVFRRRFSLNREMVHDMRMEFEVPALFRNPRYVDVTDEYYSTSNIVRNVPCEFLKKHHVAYICVFDNHDWVPVYYGVIKSGSVTFESMGRDIVYMAAVYEDGMLVPFGNPFLLKKDGTLTVFSADTERRQTMRLLRKYPFMGAEDFFNFRMDGGQFQGSNKADFSDSTIFYTHRGMTNGNWYDISVRDNGAYKYLRYIGGKGSFCNINELEFFDVGGQKIEGEIIGSEGQAWGRKENVFDGNILTGFCGNCPDGNWVGIKLPVAKQIARLRFIPRNDGNGIEVGDDYVLYCWENGRWKELVRQKALRNELCFTDMPSGGLYLLRNLTKGQEERIFSYEDGVQVWW